MCFKWEAAISTQSDRPLILVDKFAYLGRNIPSTESNVNIRPTIDSYGSLIYPMK